jgi:hypothetical protein
MIHRSMPTLPGSLRHPSLRSVLAQLGPGLFLPGLVYFLVRPHASVVVALAAASAAPALDALVRLVRRRPLTPAGLAFVLFAGLSGGLAVVLDSPMLVLAKGALVSGLLGLAFTVSAVVHRPLTRTLALRLSAEHAEHRRHLAERWGHPRAVAVFRTLSTGWGLLLLAAAGQQLAMALTLSPGLVMAVDPPTDAGVTVLGIAASVLYVRRSQRRVPGLSIIA